MRLSKSKAHAETQSSKLKLTSQENGTQVSKTKAANMSTSPIKFGETSVTKTYNKVSFGCSPIRIPNESARPSPGQKAMIAELRRSSASNQRSKSFVPAQAQAIDQISKFRKS